MEGGFAMGVFFALVDLIASRGIAEAAGFGGWRCPWGWGPGRMFMMLILLLLVLAVFYVLLKK